MNNTTKTLSAVCTLTIAAGLAALVLNLRQKTEEDVPVQPVVTTTQPAPVTTEEVTTLPLYDYVPYSKELEATSSDREDIIAWE